MKKVFYIVKPLIPRRLQLFLRRVLIRLKLKKYAEVWPIMQSAAKPPADWEGWPDRKKFAFVLTHDVEHQSGHDKCKKLIELEKKMGFKSSFNFVPERYTISEELRKFITNNGFEVGIHGLNHDGKLFQSKSVFTERAKKINQYLKQWDAVGFRAPAMHHNLEWIKELDIEYDLSTFDTDPFEPQSTGVGTIFPFRVKDEQAIKEYIELPYTLVQDFTLLVLMKEKSIDIWKRKLDWIAENGGMVLLNVHPDYINFENEYSLEEFPVKYYEELLIYVKEKYEGQYWHVLPREVAEFWRNNRLN